MKSINLLPDIKRERLQQKRREQLTQGLSVGIIAASVAVVVILSGTMLFLNRQLSNVQASIGEEQAAIEAIEDKDELIGMQKALEKLPEIDQQRILISQMPDILEQVVPNNVTVINIDYSTEGRFELTGEASSYRDIYTFVDALERVQRTTTTGDDEELRANYFTSVELIGSSPGTIINFSIRATFNTAVLLAEPGVSDEE